MLRSASVVLFAAVVLIAAASAQDENKDKNVDVRSPIGDLHLGKDADAQKAGLPVYPGAHAKNNENNDPVNLALSTESFGMKLIVAKYETNDPAEKVLAFYREKMKRYGKVLECRSTKESRDIQSDDKHDGSEPLKCEGDNNGPVRELKVGTEDNERIVAIEDQSSGKSTSFAVIYLRKHAKGDI